MRLSLALVALALVAGSLGGCLGDRGGDQIGPVDGGSLKLALAGPAVLVSDPGSRNSEFWTAQDPLDPDHMVVAILDSDDEAGGRTCSVFSSIDAGQSWTDITPPDFHSWRYTYDPWVTFTPDGGLHVVCIENANPDGPFVYARSRDGGATWDVRAIPGGGDKSIIGADRDGNLHTCSSAGELLPNYVSTDGGDEWTEEFPPDVRGMCSAYLTGPDGTLYLATTPEDNFPATLVQRISRLPPGGEWSAPVEASVVHTHFDNPACNPLRPVYDFAYAACVLAYAETRPEAPTMMHAQLAISPLSGAILLAHHNFTDSGYYHVVLRRSTDQAHTFHDVPLPPGAQSCDGCHVTRPVVGYNPHGLLGLMWKTGDGLRGYDVRFAVSPDDGATWSEEVLLASTGPTTGPYAPGGLPPNPERLANGALGAVSEDPANAEAFVTGTAFLSAADSINGDGAHYWSMAATDEVFVPMWVAAGADGRPQVWSRQVQLG